MWNGKNSCPHQHDYENQVFFARLRLKLRVLEKRGGQVPISNFNYPLQLCQPSFIYGKKLAHTSLVKIMLNVNLWKLVSGTQSVEPDVTLQ